MTRIAAFIDSRPGWVLGFCALIMFTACALGLIAPAAYDAIPGVGK